MYIYASTFYAKNIFFISSAYGRSFIHLIRYTQEHDNVYVLNMVSSYFSIIRPLFETLLSTSVIHVKISLLDTHTHTQILKRTCKNIWNIIGYK